MAEEQLALNSIIAADFGSVHTRAVLIDLVDGAYRLVARAETRTTVGDPHHDVSVGLRRALAQMSEITGRRLLFGEGDKAQVMMPERPDGSGVDTFVATASAGRPLRVVLVGLMPEVSLVSGQRALSGSYVQVTDTLSLSDVRTEEQQVNDILTHSPDLVLIVGGTDAGAEEAILNLARVVRTAVQLARPDARPTVVYAGNRVLQRRVREVMGDTVELLLADNVRPSLRDENLGAVQQELAAVFDHYLARVVGDGFDEIGQTSRLGVLPTAQAFVNIARFVGEFAPRDSAGVLAVDVGSATTTVTAVIGRRPYASIRSDLGVGHNAAAVLKAAGTANLRRWLTWDATDEEIADYVYNKTLRPATVPMTAQDLELEHALAREAIRLAVQAARPSWRLGRGATLPNLRPVIGAGAVLAGAPHPGMAALILMDALQPVGVTEILLDPVGLIPALGAVAYVQPAAAVQALDEGDLLRVGTAICADGPVRIGRGGMRITIKLADGTVEKRALRGGTIWTYPLPPGQTAQLEVRLSRGLSINGRTRVKMTAHGGMAGLIFDARGRPLPLPRQAEARARLYPAWVAGTQGRVKLRVDEIDASEVDAKALAGAEIDRLEEQAAPVLAEEAAPVAVKPRRGGLFGRRRKGAPEEEADLAEAEAAVAAVLDDSDLGFEGDVMEEVSQKPRRRGLFGRRGRRATDQTAPQETPTPEVDSTAAMLDELRLGSQEDKKRSRWGRR